MRQMTTGEHDVADIFCSKCDILLGWKYVSAAQMMPLGSLISRDRSLLQSHLRSIRRGNTSSIWRYLSKNQLKLAGSAFIACERGMRVLVFISLLSIPRLQCIAFSRHILPLVQVGIVIAKLLHSFRIEMCLLSSLWCGFLPLLLTHDVFTLDSRNYVVASQCFSESSTASNFSLHHQRHCGSLRTTAHQAR